MKLLRYKFSLLMMVLIAVLSLLSFSVPSELPRFPHADKVVHTILYFLLTFCLIFELKCGGKSQKFVCIFALIFAAFYGGLMEILQETCTELRTADWIDWFADVLGSVVAILLASLATKNSKQ